MLTIIQVGHNEASDRYIRNKIKAIREAGMNASVINLPENCCTDDVITAVQCAGLNMECRAVLVQLPLPLHINKHRVLKYIPEHKDIDGLNPYHSQYKPLTPCAIMRWLKEQKIDLEGKMVTILGRSELVGKPLANMMIDAGATVTVCNSKTPEWYKRNACWTADIIVSAVGKWGIVSLPYVAGKRQTVIDVGINRDPEGKMCGDVSYLAREAIAKYGGICTPVPGGVGKWTVRELVLRLKEMEGVEDDD